MQEQVACPTPSKSRSQRLSRSSMQSQMDSLHICCPERCKCPLSVSGAACRSQPGRQMRLRSATSAWTRFAAAHAS